MLMLGIAGALVLIGGLTGVWFLTRSDAPAPVAQNAPAAPTPSVPPVSTPPSNPTPEATPPTAGDGTTPDTDTASATDPATAEVPDPASSTDSTTSPEDTVVDPAAEGDPAATNPTGLDSNPRTRPPRTPVVSAKLPEPETLKPMFSFGDKRLRHWGGIATLDVSSDGTHVAAVGTDGRVVVWSLETGEEVKTLMHGPAIGMLDVQRNPVTFVKFASDGAILWVHGPGILAAYAWPTLDTLAEKKTEGIPSAIDCNKDGTLIVASYMGERETKVWKFENGTLTDAATIEDAGTRIAVSPDGKLTALSNQIEPIVVYNNETGNAAWTNEQLHGTSFRFSLASDRLAIYLADVIYIAQAKDGKKIKESRLADQASRVYSRNGVFSPNLLSLAISTDNEVRTYNLSNNRLQQNLRLPSPYLQKIAIRGANAYSADGSVLVSGSSLGEIRAWKMPGGQPGAIDQKARDFFVRRVKFSADGSNLFLLSEDGQIQFVDVSTGEVGSTVAAEAAGVPVIDDQGAKFVGRTKKGAALFDARSGKILNSFAPGDADGPIENWFITPDGNTVAFGYSKGITNYWLSVLSLSEQKEIYSAQLDIHTGRDAAREFIGISPDIRRLYMRRALVDLAEPSKVTLLELSGFDVIAPDDGAGYRFAADFQCVDPRSGKVRYRFDGNRYAREFESLATTHDGQWLIGTTRAGHVQLWDLQSPRGQDEFFPSRVYTVGPPLGSIRDVAVSRDGAYLATANGNGTASLFKLTDPLTPRSAPPIASPAAPEGTDGGTEVTDPAAVPDPALDPAAVVDPAAATDP